MVDWKETRQNKLPDDQKSLLPEDFRVPVLPQVMLEFSRKADDPNAKIKDLAKIVETDTGMTFELLKFVNSSAVGLRNKATTVLQALTSLGVRQTNMLLLTAAVKRSTGSAESKLIDDTEFWDTNLERALFAREVAKLFSANGDVAYTGGMLLDFLLPVLTAQYHETYANYLAQQDDNPKDLAEFEEETLGWNHATEGARLLVSWGFPDELVLCVLCHHKLLDTLLDEEIGRSPAAAVAISGLLPDSLQQISNGPAVLLKLEQNMKKFTLGEIVSHVDQQFQELSSHSEGRTSLANRLQDISVPCG